MKLSTLGWTLTAMATIISVGYSATKGRVPFITSKVVSDITSATHSIIKEEKSFGGLKESMINEIARNSYKGVRAIIDGNELIFQFKSNSGKSILESRYILEASGKLVMTFIAGNYSNQPNAPSFFKDNLVEEMNKASGN